MDVKAALAAIEENGNKPEDWIDFIRKAKRGSPKYEDLLRLYEKATSVISPDEHRKNVCYARLLVEYAKLQGMSSAEDARELFRIARCNVKRFAIVYIAWAQFELDKGNRDKCRNHLRKGKTNMAEPSDILNQALESCDQGHDRLLDDETEELIFTGTVTRTGLSRPSIPMRTVMSDSEMTTEKLLGEDNTADVPSSKADTGVISFKLPQTIDESMKQRQKRVSSSSSGEDTVTAPFHHIVKPNRSMSTTKPSLKATPDCRTVGSKSLSKSMNLSVRKPSSRMGFGKSFKFLGLPVRGKPIQSLEEEKDEDIMDSFKPIEHTTCITTENSSQNSNCPDKTATTAGQGETPNSKTEDIKQELFGNSTLSGVVENETLPENPENLNIQLNNTNSNSLWARKPCPDILMKDNHDIHEKLKATDTNSYTSCNKPALGLFENMEEASIEKQAPKVPSTPLPEKNLMSNPVSIADVHLKKNDENNSLNSQAILKQKQTNYGGQMAGNQFEIEKPVNPVCPVGVVTSASVVSSQEPNAIKNPYPLGAPHHPPKNVSSFPNNYYQPPQGKTDYPNILVNGKSYLKLGTIGRGGSSKVFRTFDGKRVCAVKYVSLEDADDFIVQSYINEINMLKRLQGRDQIIKLYDWEQKNEENSIILVLECGSIDLAGFLRKNRSTFTETELKTYWQQMLEAVNVIHNEGIIHSDLKPANFLFVEGRLKLIDFGIANSIQADQTSIQRDTQVGTLNFMSPEAFQDISGSMSHNTGRSRPCTKIGRPSDVWSLGCILYAMVYGRTPFQHITNQAMKLQCIIDENYAIEFPPIGNSKLLDVLKGSLIRDPRERYTIPHLLQHPFLSSGKETVSEPNEEQLFNVLLELAQAHVNSPRSIRVASKSICEQLRSGNKIDVSSILVKKQPQSQHAPPAGRQPLGGLSMEALQKPHGALKSTAPYMGNDKSYFDKENADLPFT